MTRQILIIILVTISTVRTFGQMRTLDTSALHFKKHTIYLEAFGIGGIYSIGYDHINKRYKNKSKCFSIGLSYSNLEVGQRPYFRVYSLPLMFSKVRFKYLETGFCVSPVFIQTFAYEAISHGTYHYVKTIEPLLFLGPKIGFRYQKPKGGFFFRLYLTILYSVLPNDEIDPRVIPWAGLSFGHSF